VKGKTGRKFAAPKHNIFHIRYK